MDPQTDLPDLVEDLEVNTDDLTDTLTPLLSTPMFTTASSLPLLDKAKLYVLAAYSIESLLFSTLQASGIDAKEHTIFRELARLKGYFGKIKEAEERGQQPNRRLDVGAAQRFIKHGLAGNERYDKERQERIAKEKARAAVKAALVNKKFDEGDEVVSEQGKGKKRGVDEEGSEVGGASEGSVAKKQKREKKSKKAKPKAKIQLDKYPEVDELPDADADTPSSSSAIESPTATTPKHSHGRRKNRSRLARAQEPIEEEIILPQRVPKTRSETFNALLEGTLPDKVAGKTKASAKGKGKGK